ncbi:MAG: LysE family translocator [Rhodobacteraceae bacterium]|nr:LysE family translocator [Paracoccaceae bacterium]
MFLSLTGLALATLWTPGPNNAMLASSGATHGLRATAPHALGVALGFGLMLGCVGLGLGAAFEARPALGIAMKYASAAVLIWIAWKIGTAGGLRSAEGRARPFRFHEAAAFQWINPKAWAMAISVAGQAAAAAAGPGPALIAAALFSVLGLMSAFGWASLGAALQGWLAHGRRMIWFNRAMAALILASVAALMRA